jgi:hypothetical protein
MPLNFKVGLSKAIGKPGGELEVSCGLDVNIDVASLENVEAYEQSIQQAFYICSDAIDCELERQRQADPAIKSNGRGCRFSDN